MADTSRYLQKPIFSEKWLGFTYAFSGTFVLDGSELTPERAQRDLLSLYKDTFDHRVKQWPRGLARFILVPVYCATTFATSTKKCLYGYDRPRSWSISMNPVLYNSETNIVEAKDAIQNNTMLSYPYIKSLFSEGVCAAAMHFRHDPVLTKNMR